LKRSYFALAVSEDTAIIDGFVVLCEQVGKRDDLIAFPDHFQTG
jgi:hypothetical protein